MIKDYFNELVAVKRRTIFCWLGVDLILLIWNMSNTIRWWKDTKAERDRKKLERKYSCMSLEN